MNNESKIENKILKWIYVDGSPRYFRVIKETKCRVYVVRLSDKFVNIDNKLVHLPGKKDSGVFNYFTKTPDGIKFEGKLLVEWTKELEQKLLNNIS